MHEWLRKYWSWLAAALAVVGLSVAGSFLPLAQWIQALSRWVATLGPFGVVIFALFYALATVLFVPGSMLTIAAGLIFGVGVGMLAAWSGAVLGSSLAFLVGRFVLRSTVEAKMAGNERFRAIDEAIGREGWKIVGLLRLSPLIPFNFSNYFYGVTKVGFWPYVLVSAGGMFPGTLLYVYLGAAGKAGLGGVAGQHGALEYSFFAVGLLATIGATVWASRMARQALARSRAIEDDANPRGHGHRAAG